MNEFFKKKYDINHGFSNPIYIFDILCMRMTRFHSLFSVFYIQVHTLFEMDPTEVIYISHFEQMVLFYICQISTVNSIMNYV